MNFTDYLFYKMLFASAIACPAAFALAFHYKQGSSERYALFTISAVFAAVAIFSIAN